jgi:hypothetical protein
MVAVMMLSAVLAAQEPCAGHVRSTEPRIVRLIDAGRARSETFRALLDRLGQSDVIVYIAPKQSHRALGGYLSHRVIAAGPCRYVRVKVESTGSDRLLLALIAHELQHAVEVAEHPDARDASSVTAMFERIALGSACGMSNCVETLAAIKIQSAVNDELGARSASSF